MLTSPPLPPGGRWLPEGQTEGAPSGASRHLPLRGRSLALCFLLLTSCRATPEQARFPKPDRPVAAIVGDTFSTEDARDRMGEFEKVVTLAGVKPGMWVADVGAGEGYYSVRLSPVVGKRGRVLAEDIQPDVTDQLAQRVQRENLDNVAVMLGEPDDPRLPAHSLDRVFLVHVYHEVASPYAFLWHMRESLKPGGLVIVVDADRPPQRHGIPPTTLRCEFAAVGFQMRAFRPIENGDAYFAAFAPVGERPKPSEIKACKA